MVNQEEEKYYQAALRFCARLEVDEVHAEHYEKDIRLLALQILALKDMGII